MDIVALVGAISFPILERIPIAGDFALSPHGLGIAVGFGLGAMMMGRRAEKRGLGYIRVDNMPDAVQGLLLRAGLGAIIGARFFFVLTHLDQFQGEFLRVFAAWEGGLTFLGGVTGAVIAAIPFARKRGWRMPMLLDSAAPGIALGLAIGRIGDLIIGDHIGAPTDFPLAWRCTANFWLRDSNSFGRIEPFAYPITGVEPTAGCFDVAVHHTALYDFGATLIVLLVLLLMERRRWFDGAFISAWVFVYGALRITSDFARNDRTWFGLTGSQWSLVAAITLVGAVLVIRKPWRRERWAWDRVFDHPWKTADFVPDGFGVAEGRLLVGAGVRTRGAHAVLSAAEVEAEARVVASSETSVDHVSPSSPDQPDSSEESAPEHPLPLIQAPATLFADRRTRPRSGNARPWTDEERARGGPTPETAPMAPIEEVLDVEIEEVLDVEDGSDPAPNDAPATHKAVEPEVPEAPWSDPDPSPEPEPEQEPEPEPEPEPRGLEPDSQPAGAEHWAKPSVERPKPSTPTSGPRMSRRGQHKGSGA